jgi:tetratricopeptide (TPR) repeat protein
VLQAASTTNAEPRTTNPERPLPFHRRPSRFVAVACGISLLLIVGAIYYPTLFFKLLTWDDDQHITNNEYFDPLTWKNVFHFWGYSYIFMYIPVSYNFFAFEVWLANWFPSADPDDKYNPLIFHAGNWLLHLGCTLWAYRIMLRFVRYAPAALCGTLLFAIHPFQAESVAWVGETRGLLATFFSLAAVWYYLNYVGVDPEQGIFAERAYEPSVRRTRDFVKAFLLFGLALLSKPSATSLPLLIVLMDTVLLRHALPRTLLRLTPWFIAAGVIFGLTKYYQRDNIIDPTAIKPWFERPLVAGDAYAFYLGKLIWPFEMGFDYGRSPVVAAESQFYYRAWIAPLLLIVASIALPRRRIWLGCYGLFLLALLPVSGIVPFIYQSISTVADRYMYVPMFGLGLLLAAWIASRRNPLVPLGITALVLGLLAGRTIEQCLTWRDDWALYANGMRINPASYLSHLNLGNRYKNAGYYETALVEYDRVLDMRPGHDWTLLHKANCFAKLGRYDEAEKFYQYAINVTPKFYQPQIGMGDLAKQRGDFAAAERWYREAVKSEPDVIDPHLMLGEFLLERSPTKQGVEQEKFVREGIAEFRAAIKLKEDHKESHRRFGRALVAAGRLDEGVVELETAVALAPHDSLTLTDLGTSYLTLGKLALAVETAERAVNADRLSVEARFNRALAFARSGKPDAALVEYEAALSLLPPGSARAAEIRKTIGELR